MKVWFENKKIGIDCDDVSFDFISGLAEFHNKKYGTKLRRSDYSTYHFKELWGCDNTEADRRVDEFLDSPDFGRILPLPGAVEGVGRLLDWGNELYIVSSRYKRLYWKTAMQIAKHFPYNAFDGGIWLSRNNYTSRGNDALGKAEICAIKRLDAMIDDSPEYALECAEEFARNENVKNSKVVLLSSPWNQDFEIPENLTEKIVRATWDEIERK